MSVFMVIREHSCCYNRAVVKITVGDDPVTSSNPLCAETDKATSTYMCAKLLKGRYFGVSNALAN